MRKGSEKPQRMVAKKWMSKMALNRLQGPIKQNKVEEQGVTHTAKLQSQLSFTASTNNKQQEKHCVT